MKQIICFFLGHKWTSKALKGLPPKMPPSMANFADHAKMYCDRCGKYSSLNSRLLLFPLLLLIFVGCVNAQQPAMAPLKFNSGTFVDSVAQIRYDTIRCIMLMSDTTHQKYTGANRLRKVDGYALNFQVSTEKQIHLPFWDYGFIVKSIYGQYYLNYSKQPKGKNIVVWQHIELEQKQKAF